jgi:XTP/dITP diphosphohydrolase
MPEDHDPARPPPSGAPLVALIEVMDALRRQCPWDRAQTHASLAPYLLEETYETLAALDEGDDAAIADELGDVLLQVYFHARVASERSDGFTIDDIAAGLDRKLRRRHPHVFPDAEGRLVAADTAGDVQVRWEQIKQDERSSDRATTAGIADGIPAALPALARAQKVLRRLNRRGVDVSSLARRHRASGTEPPDDQRERALAIGAGLLEAVRAAEEVGVDAEGALRLATAAVEHSAPVAGA